MRRVATAFIVMAAGLGVAGCGDEGGDSSAPEVSVSADATPAEYQAELDGLCRQLRQQVIDLSQQQTDGDTETAEAEDTANGYADDFEASVAALAVPPELEDAHAELIENFGSAPPDSSPPTDFIPYYQRLADSYEKLGADLCQKYAEQSIRFAPQVEKANEASEEDG